MGQGYSFFKREIYYNVIPKSLLLAFKEIISVQPQRNELNLTGYTISGALTEGEIFRGLFLLLAEIENIIFVASL